MKRFCVFIAAMMLWATVAFSATYPSAEAGAQTLRPLPVTLEGSTPGVLLVTPSFTTPAPRQEVVPTVVKPVPTANATSFGEVLLAGVIVVGAVCLAIALIGGLMGHWVIYYDKADVIGSALPGIGLIVSGFALAFSLGTFDKSGFGEKAVAILLLIGCLAITLWLAVKTIRLSIIDNGSTAVGIMVGLLKIAISWYAMLTTLEALKRVFGKSAKRTGVFQAMAQLGVMTFLAKILVNGEKVYDERGWPHR